MDYRYLGPLEVVRPGGRPARLGGPRQRAVLAVLLLRRNEVVAVDTLVDEVWSGQPPATAVAYVHNCVSRLRRELGADALETHPGGYVLHADAEEVDALRFERVVATAPALDPPERSSALREALSLWRGPPLADLGFESFALGEIRRLEELRLVALEERIEAELELGRQGDLVSELAALVERHPTRERLRGAQMRALYATGRRADALRAYQEARLALIDELGVEPGEELRALEHEILLDEPALDVAASGTATRRHVVLLYVEPEAGDTAACLATVTAAVARHGGSIERLLEDEAAAVFGVPHAHEDDGLRAVRAAIEIERELDGGARMAVVAADATAGDGAPASALDDARRLVERAAAGAIVLAPPVLRLVGPAVDAVPADGAYRLLRVVPGAPAIARRFDAPLVGRAEELARLRDTFDDVVARRCCRRVVVVGEAGIGKSRLARAFTASFGGEATVVGGSCVAYGETATYRPVAEALGEALGRRGVRRRIERLLPDDAEVLAALVEEGLPSAPAAAVNGAVRRVFEALARRGPLVLLLEDLHWADELLLDLVDYVVGWTVDVPLLLVCLARPELFESRPEWMREELLLGPLGDDDARRLAEGVRAVLDDDAVAAAVRTSGGNPLFLEQLLAFAAEGERGLPPSLDALLASRLDRLDRGERDVLGRAAVVGHECWRGALEALADDDVGPSVIALVRRRLLRPAPSSLPGEDAFAFQHVLIRDAAYASLPGDAAATLHERFARWFDARPDAADEVVGFHLEQAYRLGGAPDLARAAGQRLGRAGLAVWKANQPTPAVDLLGRAVGLLPVTDDARIELACELAGALKATGDQLRADHVVEEAIALAQSRGLRVLELRATIEGIYPRLLRGEADPDAAIRFVEAALPELEAAADDRALERAWRCIAGIRGPLQCRYADCEAAARRALLHGRRTGFSISVCLSLLAAAARYGPKHVDDAVADCLDLLAEAGADRAAEADVRTSLACLEAMRGDIEAAREDLRRARAICDEFGYRTTLTRDLALATTEVASLAAEARSVEPLLRDACTALEQDGDTAWIAMHAAALAEIACDTDRAAEAIELSRRAMELAPRGDVAGQVAWRRARARALAHTGDSGSAEELVLEALALLEQTDQVNERARALAVLAEVRELGGRHEDAGAAREQARRLFAAKGNVVLAALTT